MNPDLDVWHYRLLSKPGAKSPAKLLCEFLFHELKLVAIHDIAKSFKFLELKLVAIYELPRVLSCGE
jgi:hypothetical protein